ncbi:MAG: tetratricopeptide repeat protein, partial [Chthoniobacteraceae bacterium]|nr:tetratricopeptide repeat protein [Chthoniobacteraceae bacterium]
YLARCNRELEVNSAASRSSWMEAVNATSNNGESLFTLARMALQWGWDNEAADALWQAVSKSNRSSEALGALDRFYFAKRNTEGLYRVYSLMLDRNPGDPAVRNNFAVFCLLLDKNKEHAVGVARELHEKDPASAVYASTYALGLFCVGQTAQALEVMQALKPEALRDPSIAAYYSGFLAAAGREEEAKTYRARARGASLLPEEAQLLRIPVGEEAAQAVEAAPVPQPVLAPEVPAAATSGTPGL